MKNVAFRGDGFFAGGGDLEVDEMDSEQSSVFTFTATDTES